MPQKIILVRHGETDFNQQKIIQGQLDTFLNEKGLKQAQEIGLLLKNHSLDTIFSSDLKRAQQTAHIIASLIQKPMIITSLLRERYYGKLQGLTRREISVDVHRFGENDFWNGGWLDELFDIETDMEMEDRITSLIKQIHAYRGKNLLFVTHGGTIRVILTALGFPKEFVDDLSITNTTYFILEKKHGQYELCKMNASKRGTL